MRPRLSGAHYGHEAMKIQNWITDRFLSLPSRLFFEIGANDGRDTTWLARPVSRTLHAFEPDRRFHGPPIELSSWDNLIWNECAVGADNGEMLFYPSVGYTESGSIRAPTGHLELHPYIEFGEPYPVRVITLDEYCARNRIAEIDFIWADMQGAEGDMILGGQEALRNTRYLYMEIMPEIGPLYDGQMSLAGCLAALPGRWRIIEQWPDDVLVENLALTERDGARS
jgi:FkbM family methyltransferase